MREKIWLAEENFLIDYLEKTENFKTEDLAKIPIDFDFNTEQSIMQIKNGTAFIEIKGVLSRSGPSIIDKFFGFGGTSYSSIISASLEALENNSVKNVVLKIDTPGGEAAGVDDAFQAIYSLSRVKEVIAVNEGLIASGGYWLAAAATKIVTSSPLNSTGSIGALRSTIDTTEAEKKIGIKRIKITSENAPNKIADPSTKKGISLIQERVDAIERVFISRISQGRGIPEDQIRETFGRGAVLIAQDPDESKPDALSVGMIDEVISENIDNPKNNLKEKIITQNSETPTIVGENKMEETMNLEKVMAENPAIKIEVDGLLSTEFNKGVIAGQEKVETRVQSAMKFLGKDSSYPEIIKNLALETIKGEKSVDVLESTVISFDALKEAAKSEQAKTESSELSDITAQDHNLGKSDGEINSEEDLQAELAHDRKEIGLEV